MVNRVAPWEKLVNGGAPFNMSTELASGVAPLANGGNGGRRGTAPAFKSVVLLANLTSPSSNYSASLSLSSWHVLFVFAVMLQQPWLPIGPIISCQAA